MTSSIVASTGISNATAAAGLSTWTATKNLESFSGLVGTSPISLPWLPEARGFSTYSAGESIYLVDFEATRIGIQRDS